MIWKQKVALALALVIIIMSVPTASFGATQEEIHDRIMFMHQQIEEMEVNSVYSNVYVNSSWIDLNLVSTTGSVTTYTYSNGNPTPTKNSFTISPKSFDFALEKIVRYVLGNVANTYRQEPLNTEMTMITHKRTTVPIYVYGPFKEQALHEINLGLPDCFNIEYDTSRGRSDPVKPISMPVVEKTLEAIFSLNSTTYTINNETKTMDAQPVIQDERTYVPVRYLAYALGATEDDVRWDEVSKTVTLSIGGITEQLTLGSKTLLVNGESIEMEATPFAEDGRTYLPARWVAEPLGAQVDWNLETGETKVIITE